MINLNTKADNILELSNLIRMQNVLNKMTILTNQQNGRDQEKTEVVMRDNLYNLASKYYGSPLQWTVIAEANGLTDPEITEYTNLIIPKWDGIDRGGEFEN